MTREEANELAKTGKYKHGPIVMVYMSSGRLIEDFSPGHYLECNCQMCLHAESKCDKVNRNQK